MPDRAGLLRIVSKISHPETTRNNDRHNRITPRAVRSFRIGFTAPEDEDRCGDKCVEQSQREDRIVGKRVVLSLTEQSHMPRIP